MASCESDAEHSEGVAIGGLGLSEGLNSGVPLLDEGAELVSSNVHAVVVGVAVVALHFLTLNSDLSPGLLVSVLVEVTERDLENATTEGVGGNFYSSKYGMLIIKKRDKMERAQLTLRKWRVCRVTKMILCFEYLLYPAVLLQGVKVGTELSKFEGTCTLYHSFLMKA